MKKKIISIICILAIIASIFAVCFHAFASDISWNYDSESKTLYITGNGDMEDYTEPYSAPWGLHMLEIEKLVIEDGITSLGTYAFSGAENLSDVSIAQSVKEIGSGAFSSTPALKELTLSPSVTNIGDLSFAKLGADDKEGFILNVEPGSYALNYAVANEINFACEAVQCGEHKISIKKNTGMKAYFPYTAKVSGTFVFYSISKQDSLGYLYDSEFNEIASNDDHTTSLTFEGMDECDFALRANLEKGKTYYFATNVFSPVLGTTYTVYLEPENFTVTGDIKAVISSDGSLSEYKLEEATLDGGATNGSYELTITDDSEYIFEYDGLKYKKKFSADDGDSVDIGIVVCDRNSDGIVNAKDYAMLLKSDSKFIDYFEDLINYRY